MSLPVLSLEDARLTLQANAGPVEILKGITLAVAEGETLGLIGPSGSGKSSLLMLMGGLERASGGKVEVLGEDFTAMSEDELARFRLGRMGVVFQSFHLIPTMTALENVATPLELAGHRDAFARAEAELIAVGLGPRLNHYPSQLSGGEQQRVALARAAAPRPRILLADEPTGNLDGPNGQAIMELLFGLRDRHNATLVLVTHSPELAARCDRVVTLRDGRIADDQARPSAVVAPDAVVEAMPAEEPKLTAAPLAAAAILTPAADILPPLAAEQAPQEAVLAEDAEEVIDLTPETAPPAPKPRQRAASKSAAKPKSKPPAAATEPVPATTKKPRSKKAATAPLTSAEALSEAPSSPAKSTRRAKSTTAEPKPAAAPRKSRSPSRAPQDSVLEPEEAAILAAVERAPSLQRVANEPPVVDYRSPTWVLPIGDEDDADEDLDLDEPQVDPRRPSSLRGRS